MSELADIFGDLPDEIQRGIRDLGWSEPMPVQARVVPLMCAGRDLIVKAITGSGKTGAFGIPIVVDIDPELADESFWLAVGLLGGLNSRLSPSLGTLARQSGHMAPLTPTRLAAA